MTDSVADRLAGTAYAAGWATVKALPHPLAAAGFRAAADLAVRRDGPRVHQLRANLSRVVGPDTSTAELAVLTQRAVRSYARYWLETFRLPAMRPADIAARVHVTGAEHVDAAYGRRGVILALPHMGNWDAAGVWMIDRGVPFTTVAERLKPESLFTRFVAYRESLGMEVLALHGGERPPVDVLRERLGSGGLVGLVADRDLSEAGIPVTFFGAPASMPAGPALLAVTTGAALLPTVTWNEGPDWSLAIRPPLAVPAGGRLRDRVRSITQALADRFAADIAARPEDWHMLQPFWVADRERQRTTVPVRAG